MKRQRLRRLRRELATLGLQGAALESLTEADVRAARAARAKVLHPDAAGRRSSLWGDLLGGSGSALRQARASHDAMSELNAAHDAVRKAVVAPMYL